MDSERNLMPIGQVEAEVGVSRTKLWRMLRAREISAFTNPRDRRQKLLDLDEVKMALEPEMLLAEERKAIARRNKEADLD